MVFAPGIIESALESLQNKHFLHSLAADYEALEELFGIAEISVDSGCVTEAQEAIRCLARHLKIYLQLEKEFLYPALRAAGDYLAAENDLIDSAQLLLVEINALEAAVSDRDSYRQLRVLARLDALQHEFVQRVAQTRQSLFPLLRRTLSTRLEELGRQLRERKSELEIGLCCDLQP